MTATTATKKGCGCGCGGGATTAASPCQCGGASCSLCQDQSFVRPRFFAGQLLTEDDLQLLEDYSLAKNRLHMRHLFGAGVVCGLEVTCYPCGGGKVIVNPGYALDCCGNDIVVSCSTELDINQMIREFLRKQRGGADCGDPCAGTVSSSGGTSPAGVPTTPATTTQTGTSGSVTPQKHAHKYCLYVNYCEQASDPVAPYATDDPCTSTACETTRTKEGFRFELRCPPPANPSSGICGSISDCLGDETAYSTVAASNQRLGTYFEKYQAAYNQYQQSPVRVLGQTFVDDWKTHVENLDTSLKVLTTKPQDAVDNTVIVASDLASWQTQDNLQLLARTANADTTELIKATTSSLNTAFKAFQSQDFQTQYSDTLDVAWLNSLNLLSTQLLSLANTAATSAPTTTADVPAHDTTTQPELLVRTPSTPAPNFSFQLLAYGAPYTAAFHNEALVRLDGMDAWIENRLAQAQAKTHCTLPRLDTLPAPATGDVSRGQFSQLLDRGTQRLTTVFQLIRDCICNAINPPCPDCDDTGVLLACITVCDCQVIDICNLERTFVLTWPTIRYWIPEIAKIGNAFESLCCPSQCDDTSTTSGFSPGRFAGRDPNAATALTLLALLVAECGIKLPIRNTSASFASDGRNQIVNSLRDFFAPSATATAAAAAPSPSPTAATTASAPNEALTQKLVATQHNFDLLSRDHRKLLDRVGKLEKAVARKGVSLDA